jgi:hypothetical protein
MSVFKRLISYTVLIFSLPSLATTLSKNEIIVKSNALKSDSYFVYTPKLDNYISGEVLYFLFNDKDKLFSFIDTVHTQNYSYGYRVKFFESFNYQNSNFLTFVATRDSLSKMCYNVNKTDVFNNLIKPVSTTFGSKAQYHTTYINDLANTLQMFSCAPSQTPAQPSLPNYDVLRDYSAFKFVNTRHSNSKNISIYFDERNYTRLIEIGKQVQAYVGYDRGLKAYSIDYNYVRVTGAKMTFTGYRYTIFVTLSDSCKNDSITIDSFNSAASTSTSSRSKINNPSVKQAVDTILKYENCIY